MLPLRYINNIIDRKMEVTNIIPVIGMLTGIILPVVPLPIKGSNTNSNSFEV